MTTKVKIELCEHSSFPVCVHIVTPGSVEGGVEHASTLKKAGDSVEVYIHQNQDVVVGELKANHA